jgi:hypothetical protein
VLAANPLPVTVTTVPTVPLVWLRDSVGLTAAAGETADNSMTAKASAPRDTDAVRNIVRVKEKFLPGPGSIYGGLKVAYTVIDSGFTTIKGRFPLNESGRHLGGPTEVTGTRYLNAMPQKATTQPMKTK